MKTVPVLVLLSATIVLAACGGGDKKLELGGSCSLNSDCADGLLCKFGACHKACMKSVDCASGERCVQVDSVAVCQLASEQACDQYGNCRTPLSCRAVDNTCRNRCTPTGNECLPGQLCLGTVCVENTEAAASPDASMPGTDAPAGPDISTPANPDAAPDRPQMPDASTGSETGMPGEAGGLQTCVDKDGDGYGVGAGCRGPDCDDTNTNVWASCGACVDSDGDGYFVGCDRYSTVQGPDCDDTAPFCSNSCVDGDKNGTADCAEYWLGEATGPVGGHGFPTADGNRIFFSHTTSVGFGNLDIQATKITPSGRVVWQKLYGTGNYEAVNVAHQLSDGTFLLAGECGVKYPYQPLYLHLDQEGTVLASKTAQKAPGTDWPSGLVVLPSGNFLVTGGDGSNPNTWLGELNGDLLSFEWVTQVSSPGSVVVICSMLQLPGGDTMAALSNPVGPGQIVRLGPKGEVRWAQSGFPSILRLALSGSDGNVAVASAGPGKPFAVTKITPDGSILWHNAAVATGGSSAAAFEVVATDGTIYAGGFTAPSGASRSTWLVKLTGDGSSVWTRSTGVLDPHAIELETDGSMFMSGSNTLGRIGADPTSSCILGAQTDVLKPSTLALTSLAATSAGITPWALADYAIKTMPGMVTWTRLCPAKP